MAVLISIQPQWCELIASGKKTLEVRKTKPRLKTPFKCYIYETKDMSYQYRGEQWWRDDGSTYGIAHFPGKVVGEFVCDGFDEFTPTEQGVMFRRFKSLYDTCLTVAQIRAYLNGKAGYGWHISDLVIYDRPILLEAFGLKRPPQSWRYVDDVKKILGIQSPSEAWRQLNDTPELEGGADHELVD